MWAAGRTPLDASGSSLAAGTTEPAPFAQAAQQGTVPELPAQTPTPATGSQPRFTGHPVTLDSWVNRGDRLARVRYRDALWDAVVARGATPCGLASRDTLRLEVCYPLHGNDITQSTDAISAGLGWTCDLTKDFTGVSVLREVKERGPDERLVAFVMEEKAVPRQGMAIVDGGTVTSGTHSPSLDVGIGLAYVPAARAAVGTEIVVDVRGKERRARIVKKPIYQHPTSTDTKEASS